MILCNVVTQLNRRYYITTSLRYENFTFERYTQSKPINEIAINRLAKFLSKLNLFPLKLSADTLAKKCHRTLNFDRLLFIKSFIIRNTLQHVQKVSTKYAI